MARLYAFTGVCCRKPRPFSTSGHLTGTLGENGRWTYDNFKGKVGESDINGKLEFEMAASRATS
jgi:hypothetical protein